jgi:hypothetical protein
LFDPDLLSEDLDSLEEQLQEIDSDIARHKDMLDLISWNTESEKVKRITAEIEELRNKKSKLLSDKPIKEINQSLDAKITSSFKHSRVGLKKYRLLQRKFFNELDKFKKENLRNEMHNLEWDIIESVAERSGNSRIVAKLKDMRDKSTRPFFLWKLYFSEVFGRENPGFDCVIGNPPYIQLQGMDEEDKKSYSDNGYITYAATGDIYCLFYEKGYNLLRNDGTLGFITSNKWMKAGYGQKLRSFFAKNTNPLVLIDFAGQKVFEEATVDVNILLFAKSENLGKTKTLSVVGRGSTNLSEYVEQLAGCQAFTDENSWTILSPIEQGIKEKMERIGTPLKEWNIAINYGIKTGFNEAFIIDGKKKDELIAADPKSAEIIRPILRGKDVKRYGYNFPDLWLLNIHNGIKEKNIPRIDVANYPAVKTYLKQFDSQLNKRYDKGDTQYNLRNCAYMEDFSQQKIVWGNLCLSAQYCLVDEGYYVNAPSPFIVPGNKYILAILNSKIADWYIRGLGVTRSGGYFEYKPMFVEKLPIPKISESKQKVFCNIIDELLLKKKNKESTTELEKLIDDMTYELYDINITERQYLDNL